MGSSGKKRTTMAKLTRESRLRERRLDKQARKDARKNAPPEEPVDPLNLMLGESGEQTAVEPAPVEQDVVEQAVVEQD
jgi:hypothetical protein